MDLDGTSVYDHSISCNGKSKACTADLPRMRLVHTVKPLKNMRLVFLRDSDSRIFYFDITELVICIQGYMHPSVIVIIFDRILNQI